MSGDVSDNGQVTAYDASMILRHTIDLITLVDRDALVADVSGNGTIAAYDAALVLQYVTCIVCRCRVRRR